MLCHSSGILQRGLQEVLVWTPVQCEQGLQDQSLSPLPTPLGCWHTASTFSAPLPCLWGGELTKECPVRNPGQHWLPDICFTHLAHNSLPLTSSVGALLFSPRLFVVSLQRVKDTVSSGKFTPWLGVPNLCLSCPYRAAL